jgi:hypothetical protein
VTNDSCNDATEIDSLPFAHAGNNLLAIDTGDDEVVSKCDFFTGVNYTVWYYIDGDGGCLSAELQASGSAALFLFDGDCGGLECVSQDYGTRRISWETELGRRYYILVAGYYGDAGVYSLNVEVSPLLSPQAPLPNLQYIPFLKEGRCISNGACEDAIDAGDIASQPFVDSRSNEFSSLEGNSSALSCFSVSHDSRTMWYTVTGFGECVSASVVSTFSSVLAVYAGDCESLECLKFTSYSDDVLTWRAENGTTYKLVLASSFGPESGDFLLTIASTDMCSGIPTSNDVCDGAIKIDEPSFREESNNIDSEIIAANNSALVCSVVKADESQGRWYSVEADAGHCISAKADAFFPTVIAVYSGDDCGDLTCAVQSESIMVAFNEVSWALWRAEAETTYRVFVASGGSFGEVGNIDFSLEVCNNQSNNGIFTSHPNVFESRRSESVQRMTSALVQR